MSATFRSHFRSAAPKNDETSREHRTQFSRIPTKHDNTPQHVSRLAKRASTAVKPSNKTEDSTKSASNLVTTAQNTSFPASKRASVTPRPETSTPDTSGVSMARHNVLQPPPAIRTPSLVSGSSVSTFDSPRTNGLRRKPSSIEQYAASRRGDTPGIDSTSTKMHRRDQDFDEAFEDSILGITLPSTTYGQNQIPEPKYRLPQGMLLSDVTREITPPVLHYASSSTPSTRNDSPFNFSQAPTPSSTSSYSPGIAVTSNLAPRIRQQSPTRSRPPVANHTSDKGHGSKLGLPPVRESSTSSSNSTVKPSDPRTTMPRKENNLKTAGPQTDTKPPDTSRPISRGKLTKEKPKQASLTSTAKATPKVPPELAHLNVEPSRKPSLNKSPPPVRPSRDGTQRLTGLNNPSPVVQSDLPQLYTTYHKRTPSQESPANATSPSFKSRFGMSPKITSKQPSPRIDSAISPVPATRTFARDLTPEIKKSEGHRESRKDSPAVVPAPSPSKTHRFGFFSRKPKDIPPKPAEKPPRPPSKGPTAGTGHEGYGRFSASARGRTSSNGGSTTSSTGIRSPSTASASTMNSQQKRVSSAGRQSSVTSKDGSDLDDFLRERLNPIVLRGSGSTISNAPSNADTQTPSMPASSNHSSLDRVPKPQLLPSAIDISVGQSPIKKPTQPGRTPSDSSEDDINARYPSLAARRSINRFPQANGKTLIKVPAPINTNASKNSSMDSYDAENSDWPKTDSTVPTEEPFGGKEGLWLRSGLDEPDTKAPRKWNFFQRAQAASPRNKGKEKASALVYQSPPQSSPHRRVAHYATMSPVEPVGMEEVERIMQETTTSPEDSMSESNAPRRLIPYEQRHKSLLPSPPRREHSNDSDLKAELDLPQILVRFDSAESPELMRAERAVQPTASRPQQAHVIDIQRSPILSEPEFEEQDQLPGQLQPASRQNVSTPEGMNVPFNSPENPGDSPQRHPRLSPVGRIPKVISKRDRDRKLSDSSFSRPFARTQPRPSVKPPGSLYNQIREHASPVESGSQPVSSTSTNSNNGSGEQHSTSTTNPPSASTNRTSMEMYAGPEFFVFPRKDSDFSYSSSSATNSIMATAQLPQVEDIWNEYDDLLDDVIPHKTRQAHLSTTSSLGAPFQYSTALYDSPAFFGPESWSQPPAARKLPEIPRSHTTPAVLSVPQQIARFMQPSMSPLTTPRQLGELVDHYGNRSTSTLISADRTSAHELKRTSIASSSRSSIPGPNSLSVQAPKRTSQPGPSKSSTQSQNSSSTHGHNRLSAQGPNRSSIPSLNRSSLPRSSKSSITSARASTASTTRHSRSSGHSRSASLPEVTDRNSQSSLRASSRFNRDTQLLDIAEVDGDEQAAAANLRFGALMTSKWLSFGRVLFSPAHNEMRLADEPRVLILDGLGSDWSYYVALSYPTATVYNLGPAPVNGTSAWPGVNQKPPSNHRHITHAAISAAFPFPKGFFTAVVFRFPIATTDQAYQACIFECRRVLRPGGYLEVAALDLDLMNMGNKARKEVRGLKTRMQTNDQNVSLRNLSDVLVRLIGRRGFEEIQRCIVGVPAAGRIPRSQDISSVSSETSGKRVWQREDRDGQDFSFSDLLEDARANEGDRATNNDESITKMVAKVGRWWYSACYEKSVLQMDNSIWNDHNLLRECEKQGTSFRLLICYAQKPTQTKRRTMSV